MSESEVRSLSKKLDKVLSILHNDDETSRKGLVAEVAEVKHTMIQFINQYQIDQAIKKGKETVWKIVWGAVGAALLTLGKFIVGLILK